MYSFPSAMLAVVAAASLFVTADITVPDLRYLTAYEGNDLTGPSQVFLDSSPDLSVQFMDNVIGSVCGTGEWMFYDDVNYKFFNVGLRGFDVCLNLSDSEVSSLRYAGSPNGLNDVYYNLYENTTFSGAEFTGNANAGSLEELDMQVSSLIISGQSPWTFFTGPDYTGEAVCLYPNLTYTGSNGLDLDTFWIPYMTFMELPDNSIRSVAKGCLSSNVIRAEPLPDALRVEGGEMRAFRTLPLKNSHRADDSGLSDESDRSLKSSHAVADNDVRIVSDSSLNPSHRVYNKEVKVGSSETRKNPHQANEKNIGLMRDELLLKGTLRADDKNIRIERPGLLKTSSQDDD